MTAQNIFTLTIGGMAGQGIKSMGLVVAKVATRSGYHVYDYIEYPSLIRGGHNVMQINVSKEVVTAPRLTIDLLVALNQDTVDKHHKELVAGSGVIFDSTAKLKTSLIVDNINLFPVPLSQIANDSGGKELLSNTVALGAVIALAKGNLQTFKDLLNEEYGDKGKEVIEANYKAAEAGYKYVIDNFSDKIKDVLVPVDTMGSLVPLTIFSGNEAVALGAIAAGLQFAAIYPMSPASNILHVLAANQEKYGFIYKQPEDEISAINMAIGASYAGARSMTSTSGGGFCLMTEAYGLAGMTETPLVIVDGMRPGPATGLPSWSEQGDLKMVLSAHQGDFPRIVLAAADAKDAFDLTMKAFNLADKYQTPVILLIDKDICENDQSYDEISYKGYKIDRGKFTTEKVEDYKRYKSENDGISQRTVPGVGNYFLANSDEHDEIGYSSEEIADRNIQMHKRMTKLETCTKEDMQEPQLFGPENADITIVSWGSNKGSILQAMKDLKNVNYLHITWMNPFPAEAVKKVLMKAKHVVDIECNYTGQLADLVREKTSYEIVDRFLKYDGRPIYPEEIIERLRQ